MKAWSIKYIATRGVEELEGDIYREGEARKYFRSNRLFSHPSPVRIGTAAFLSREEAVTAGCVVLTKKIASAEKQAKALRAALDALSRQESPSKEKA